MQNRAFLETMVLFFLKKYGILEEILKKADDFQLSITPAREAVRADYFKSFV